MAGPRHTKCVLVVLDRFRKQLQRCAGRREIRISSLERPKFYSSRAYLPRQAAGIIRAEGCGLGKFEDPRYRMRCCEPQPGYGLYGLYGRDGPWEGLSPNSGVGLR